MDLHLNANAEDVSLVAGDGANKLPTFSITAYTGVPMRFPQYYNKVIVDLSTLKLAAAQTPILREHDANRIVGHGDVTISPQRLKVDGVISGVGPDAQEIAATGTNKFPWQASIRVDQDQPPEFIDPGKKVTVNGRVWTGPVLVARDAILKEVSFVPMGRDGASTATVSASASQIEEGNTMEFSAWLKAKGFDEATLNDAQKTSLKASFDSENELTTLKASTVAKPPVVEVKTPVDQTQQQNDWLTSLRASSAGEMKRQSAIMAVCKSHPDLCATAIEEGWTVEKAELHVMRKERPKAPDNPHGKESLQAGVLEAAFCEARMIPNYEKQYSDQVLQAAHTQFRGRIRLQQAILMAAAENGMHVGPGTSIDAGNIREVLEFAFPSARERSLMASSTVSLPGILSNVANKDLLAGYLQEDQTWREVAAIKSVQNFQLHTSYRMLDNMEYEKLGPSGEIKHGGLGEESYTRSADTYAKMFTLTRKTIINDDLSAFDDLRTRVGRGAGLKLNRLFWTTFLANSAFFTTGRGNYIIGATSNLGVDGVGLEQGIVAFDALRTPAADGTKAVGGRVAGRADRILHPSALQFNADRLYQSTNVNTGGSSTAASIGNANIYVGKYRPIKSVWLDDPSIPGYSTTGWYLLRDPALLAAVVVSFLNGQQNPTVETAQADFDTLGVQFRGYHDFGIDFAEYLCGIKSKGAA